MDAYRVRLFQCLGVISNARYMDNVRLIPATVFLDLIAAPQGTPPVAQLPERERLEQVLYESSLQSLLAEVDQQRRKETKTIEDHLNISLETVID
ncbi:hypothetical protein WDW89_03740 [Deltaproteobacteria bacterium TL4]